MKEQLITFTTAILAKEKGFNFPKIASMYVVEKVGNRLSTDGPELKEVNPTQSLLQKWLREEHWIEVNPFGEGRRPHNTLEYQCEVNDDRINKSTTIKGRYKTYEEALEKGLQEALKLIKL